MNQFEKHIQVEEDVSILECLTNNTDLSKQKIKKVMQNGAVWLENKYGINRVRRAKKSLVKGDVLHFYYNGNIQLEKPPEAKLISDEGGYSIWNKPCGMYSQGTKWGDHCTIYRWAELNLIPERKAFIVHRLDKAANGLILLAHTKKMAMKLSAMFEKREIKKTYQATVEGCLDGLDLPFEINEELDGKKSISEIVQLKQDKKNNKTLIDIKIKTGRKHQIRRHLSGLGYSIVGDRLYGARDVDTDLQLSSIELEFTCPISAEQKKYKLPL